MKNRDDYVNDSYGFEFFSLPLDVRIAIIEISAQI